LMGGRMEGETKKTLVGRISHYYNKAGVAVVQLSGGLRKGDRISIEGANTNFTQTVESMQIEHAPIEMAKAGQSIGLKVSGRVHEGDSVFRLE